jgi:hypothetical protein
MQIQFNLFLLSANIYKFCTFQVRHQFMFHLRRYTNIIKQETQNQWPYDSKNWEME